MSGGELREAQLDRIALAVRSVLGEPLDEPVRQGERIAAAFALGHCGHEEAAVAELVAIEREPSA